MRKSNRRRKCKLGRLSSVLLFAAGIYIMFMIKQYVSSGLYLKSTIFIKKTVVTPLDMRTSTHFDLNTTTTSTSIPASQLGSHAQFNSRGTEDRQRIPYITLHEGSLYLFSAFVMDKSDNDVAQTMSIAVNVWQSKTSYNLYKASFEFCCILNDNSVVKVHSRDKSSMYRLDQVDLLGVQYRGIVENLTGDILGISLSVGNHSCQNDSKYFLPPETPIYPITAGKQPSIAVCTKCVYANVSASRLIEWMEAHILFGADKILMNPYQLHGAARAVIEYYKQKGFLETVEIYELPDQGKTKRNVGDQNLQYWSDEQVMLYDCAERLQKYDFNAVVDIDEFIIPNVTSLRNAWKTFFVEHILKTDIATMFFFVRFHFTDAEQFQKNDPMLIGRFMNSTYPVYDRPKEVFMPSRIIPGSVYTHDSWRREGFRSMFAPAELVSVHHFRSCRDEWKNPLPLSQRYDSELGPDMKNLFHLRNATISQCEDYKLYHSQQIQQLAEDIRERVMEVRKILNI